MVSFFSFGRSKRPGGLIAGYSPQEWWIQSFTKAEHLQIQEALDKPYSVFKEIDKGQERRFDDVKNTLSFLSSLMRWFERKDRRQIGWTIFLKAREYEVGDLPLLNRHYVIADIVGFLWTLRTTHPQADEFALIYAKQMISFQRQVGTKLRKEDIQSGGEGELPGHLGYETMCKILLRRGDVEEAAAIARDACKNGWSGTWEKFMKSPPPLPPPLPQNPQHP